MSELDYVKIRALAEAVLAKIKGSREIERRGRSASYRPVTVTVGEAETLARYVLALVNEADRPAWSPRS